MLLKVLGGVNEKGKVSFLLTSQKEKKTVLFDYGIKRIIGAKNNYPPLIKEKIALLVISHAHMDHTGAIPLLNFERCFSSKITQILLKDYIKKWMNLALKFKIHIEKSLYEEFLEKDFECQYDGNSNLTFGKSGHLLGSLWTKLKCEGIEILYTGDINLNSNLYTYDEPVKSDVLILDIAHGNEKIPSKENFIKILKDSKENIVILPLPSIGRSQEILKFMIENDINPIFVDKKILNYWNLIKENGDWLKDYLNIDLNFEFKELPNNPVKLKSGIYLTTDGMMTSGSSLKLYRLIENRKNVKIILTGFQEKGTLGRKLLEEKKAIFFLWKVHPSIEEIMNIIERVSPRYLIPFHAEKEDTSVVVEKIKKNFPGIEIIYKELIL